MNSVLVDTSFLICLSSTSRPHHELAKEYFQRFIGAGVMMHLSTIVISEFEVRQRISDLGLNNFMTLPFNIDHAIVTARIFDAMFAARQEGDARVAIKDDAKLIGQCVAAGISHFITDDASCAGRLNSLRSKGTTAGLPHPINLYDGFWEGWFNEDNQGRLL
ncbi:type II toxin-antitoxin system VapC family toxin [Caballeronia sp. DA-9]|uniref:type II toxin-antitoxin system VapC family toxin n=1 Tax=Caballeronia sp. DA-9 TaxID=3436237 RepID=UPI003F6625F9